MLFRAILFLCCFVWQTPDVENSLDFGGSSQLYA